MLMLYLLLFAAGSVSGFVTDASNGEKLAFANIYFEDLDIGFLHRTQNQKRAGTASFGLITSKLLIEGPILKGSFLFSGRRTYFDALLWGYSLITGDSLSLSYYFWDGIVKVNFNPLPDDRFTLTALGGAWKPTVYPVIMTVR